jgi:hypothetical protein
MAIDKSNNYKPLSFVITNPFAWPTKLGLGDRPRAPIRNSAVCHTLLRLCRVALIADFHVAPLFACRTHFDIEELVI